MILRVPVGRARLEEMADIWAHEHAGSDDNTDRAGRQRRNVEKSVSPTTAAPMPT